MFCVLTATLSSVAFGVEAQWTIRNKARESITVVAHRGAGDLAPENCLSSLELTWGMGGIPEVDVRTTKDGHIMMFHDGNFQRVCPDAPEEIRKQSVETMTYDEVRSLDVGSYLGEEFKGAKVVSIEEIVDALKQDLRREVVIDVKKVDFQQLADALQEVRFQVTLTSGNEDDLAKWADINPSYYDATLWMGLGSYTDEDVEKRFQTLREKNFKGIKRLQIHIAKDADGNLRPSPACIRARAEECRARGIEFQTMPWRTKDCPHAETDIAFYKELIALGSMGFGTDRPDCAFQALDEFYAESPEDWNVCANIPRNEFLLQGHRGLGNEAPEGTLPTFREAWERGLTPEADIRMTKDGVIMSFHDNDFRRIIPSAPDEVKKQGVKDFTYEECRKLDVGAYKGEEFKGQQMADLDEMIAALKEDPQRMVFFDIKKVDFKLLAELTQEVHPQIIMASSNYNEIKEWKKYAPRSKAMLWMPTTWAGTPEDLEDRFNVIRDQDFAGLYGLQIHVTVDENGQVKPSPEVLRRCGTALRKKGVIFETLSWTNGNKALTYDVLLDCGCASFATDYPTETVQAINDYYEKK
ncbi:MAG: glycerophosphodiester phosphodiesterase family protein [Planctomycetia bacterium]|nr:glycerophosphodiester phosphodiesterase family protein [Planctomycetia bacterium]